MSLWECIKRIKEEVVRDDANIRVTKIDSEEDLDQFPNSEAWGIKGEVDNYRYRRFCNIYVVEIGARLGYAKVSEEGPLLVLVRPTGEKIAYKADGIRLSNSEFEKMNKVWRGANPQHEAFAGDEPNQDPETTQKTEMEWEDYLWKEDVHTLKMILDDMLHDEKYESSPRQLEILKTVIRRKELGEARVQEQGTETAEPGIETETEPTTTPSKPKSPIAPKPGVTPKPKAKLTPEQQRDLELFLKSRGKA